MGGKFHGTVGFAEMKETAPGVWTEQITERTYFGDIQRAQSRSRGGQSLNNNIVNDNRISIVADPYANEKYPAIRYVIYLGTKWQVNSVEANRPRLLLVLGEVYNEQTSRASREVGGSSGV